VKIRDMDFRTRSARRTLVEPVVADRVLWRVARELLARLCRDRRVPAQYPGADQLALFASSDPLAETDRDRILAQAVDRVRERFGPRGIMPASLSRPD
jgi:hypothetical protein